MSIGMALEGCACRAAFHAGVVERLSQAGITPAAVAGASSGAIIAAGVAVGGAQDLTSWWLELGGTRVFQPSRVLSGAWPIVMSEIQQNVLVKYLGTRRLDETQIPLRVAVSVLRGLRLQGHTLAADDGLSLVEGLMASTFIPGVYSRPIYMGRRLLLDGAWTCKVPIESVISQGAKRIIAILANRIGHILDSDLRRRTLTYSTDQVRVIYPPGALPVGYFDFDRARTEQTMDIGRRSAETFLRDNSAWLEDA